LAATTDRADRERRHGTPRVSLTRVSGTLPVTQSEWGIKPYRAFMGALKVRATVEIVVDVRLPTD